MTTEEKEKLIKADIKKAIIILIILGVGGISFIFGTRLLDNQLMWLTQQLGLQQVANDSTVYLSMKNQFALFTALRNVGWMLGAVGSMALIAWGSLIVYKTRKTLKKEGEKE